MLSRPMALSCGRRKQGRKKGGGGGGGCRHFHVHYHLPRRVCAFSFLGSLPRVSLVSCVLIPPVLFFAVIAFLVSFVWFTLLYFVVALFNKNSNHGCSKSDSVDHAGDVGDHRKEDDGQDEGKEEEKAVNRVAELTVDSAAGVEMFKIEEVHGDGLSHECQSISRMASSDASVNYDVHDDCNKLVEEVIIFEINREGSNGIADLDCFSQRHQIDDVPIDLFVEEPNIREDSISGDSFPIVLSSNSSEVYDFPEKNKEEWLSMDFLNENKKNIVVTSNNSSDDIVEQIGEELVCTSSQSCDFIDKHETGEVVLDCCTNDSKIRLFASSDGSVRDDGIQDEHKKENKQENDANSVQELLANSIATLEIFDKPQEIKKVVFDDNRLPEVPLIEANGKLVIGTSNVDDCTDRSETSGLPFDSVCEDKNGTIPSSNASLHRHIGDQDGKHEELHEKNREEASDIASVFCGYADNDQTREALDGLANEDSIGEVASLDNSAYKRNKDEDDNCVSKGAPRIVPLVRRSPVPWWNLCGVLDVFAGSKD